MCMKYKDSGVHGSARSGCQRPHTTFIPYMYLFESQQVGYQAFRFMSQVRIDTAEENDHCRKRSSGEMRGENLVCDKITLRTFYEDGKA